MKMIYTKRDYSILTDLSNNIFSSSQIAKLYFTSRKKAAERLKVLFDLKLINRFPHPFVEKQGRGEFVYFLSKRGKTAFENHFHCRLSSVINPLKDIYSLPHRLMISDVYVALHSPENPDLRVRFHFSKTVGIKPHEMNGIIPDGIAVIEKISSGKKLLHFIEVDCSSEPVFSGRSYSIENKMQKYVELFDNYEMQKSLRDLLQYNFRGFRVLFITKDITRLHNLRNLSADIDTEFFWFAEQKHISPDHIFNPVWSNLKYQNLSLAGSYPERKEGK